MKYEVEDYVKTDVQSDDFEYDEQRQLIAIDFVDEIHDKNLQINLQKLLRDLLYEEQMSDSIQLILQILTVSNIAMKILN